MIETKKILTDLKNKIYKPIYFLYGTEALYIDQVTDFIEDKVLSASEKSFNQTVLYGRDVDASIVVEVCSRLPMMASHQVVIVKEAQDLIGFDFFESSSRQRNQLGHIKVPDHNGSKELLFFEKSHDPGKTLIHKLKGGNTMINNIPTHSQHNQFFFKNNNKRR